MEYLQIIINQILTLSILVIIGIIATKFKIITEEVKKGITNLLMDITIPLLIISSFAKTNLNSQNIKDSLYIVIFTYIALFLFLFFGKISSKLFKLKNGTSDVHILHTAFGNIVFLGFPLINALFPGGEALLYAVVFQMVGNSLLWTVAVIKLQKNKKIGFLENIKHLLNINTIAFFIGIVLMLTKTHLPKILDTAFSGIGHTTFYLSMLLIGAMLTESKLKSSLKKMYIFSLSFNKLISIPMIIIVLLKFSKIYLGIALSETAEVVLVLETSMPCMAILAILAKKYDSDYKQATENIYISTILSIVTIPFIYIMIGKIL